MALTVIGGDGKPTGYEIDNSLRLGPSGGGTTPHVNLRRTLGSAGTEETFTYSCWIKISAESEYNYWLLGGSQETSSPNQATYFRISSNDKLRLSDGSVNLIPNRLFRDPNAWYHLVLAVDSTQGTASNRVKMYVNGVQETSFDTETYPDQNLAFRVLENGVTQSIGTWIADDGTAYACDDGYISEVYLIDGQQLDSSYFGETNDDGVWVPKDYTGTYGTHGFRFEFKQTGSSANSSGIGADTSGNDNHFSVNNSATTDITTDTPTNNFNTLTPLVPHHSIFAVATEGNTGLSSSGVELRGGHFGTTIMPSNGKWYFEVKILSTGSSDRTGLSIANFESVVGDDHIEGGDFKGFTISTGTTARVFVTNGSSTVETDISGYQYSDDDIAIFAVDMDASTPRVYVGKNGTWFTTSAATGGNPASDTGYFETILGNHFSVGARHSAGSSTSQSYLYNFGQPAFSISSGNADANGYGNFEYAVPSGYYAICTKNLAEYG